jgi:hypothetical protein
MRRTLGTLVATTLLLTGCGTDADDSGPASDPASTTSAPDDGTSPADGVVEHRLVELVTVSQVGGAVSPRASVLDDASAVATFTDPFEGSRMTESVEAAVRRADPASDEVLAAAVVAIGCDAPQEVSVERRGDELLVHPGKIPTTKQCLVPMTTVALVAVPESAA